jgi:hypothetical protein
VNSCRWIVSALFALAVLAGCASTQVTQQTPMVSPGLARPNQIYVYDFIADPAQIPPDSSISAGVTAPSTPPTAEELETGGKLGALIAQNLAADIQGMGLSAMQAVPGSVPQVGDGVIRGYLISVEGGSKVKRFVIGFGSGASEMDTIVEGYAVTPQVCASSARVRSAPLATKCPVWSHRPRSPLRPAIRSGLSLWVERRFMERRAARIRSRGEPRRPRTQSRSSRSDFENAAG